MLGGVLEITNNKRETGTAPAQIRGSASVVVSKWADILMNSGYDMAAWKVKCAFNSPPPKQNRKMAPVAVHHSLLRWQVAHPEADEPLGTLTKAHRFRGDRQAEMMQRFVFWGTDLGSCMPFVPQRVFLQFVRCPAPSHRFTQCFIVCSLLNRLC